MNAISEFQPDTAGVLRFMTAGSVDDGKSTLIGRLLYDSKGVFADQLQAVARAKYRRTEGDEIDLSLLTDGLEAEREQGITIDVAYRYFATPRRKFIVADAPGHEQYTRNMVTAASTSDTAIILIDAVRARDGVLLPQTRRHSTIARLLGMRHIVVAVNKMDLVGWDQAVFDRIQAAYAELAQWLGIAHFDTIPISALRGDNVVTPSTQTPWYTGQTLLETLEGLALDTGAAAQQPLRLPVQLVARHGGSGLDDFRGYMGEIATGTLQPGDRVRVLPEGFEAVVQRLVGFAGDLAQAKAGDPVTVVLDREVDVSRGDVIVSAEVETPTGRQFEADLCWLDQRPLSLARKYTLKQGTRLTTARIQAVQTRRDISRLEEVDAEADTVFEMNDIGRVSISTRDSLLMDAYEALPATGAFILIDPATHQTVAAGLLRQAS